MMDFISNNSSAISAGANVIMVIVWITYLQLMLNGIIRQRRSSLIVSSSLKSDAAARCFGRDVLRVRSHAVVWRAVPRGAVW